MKNIKLDDMDIESNFNSLLVELKNGYASYNNLIDGDDEPEANTILDHVDGMLIAINTLFGFEHREIRDKSYKFKAVELLDENSNIVVTLNIPKR